MKPVNIPQNHEALGSFPTIVLAKTSNKNNKNKMPKKAAEPGPPDEETLRRLNILAKQYPFCILHREKDIKLL